MIYFTSDLHFSHKNVITYCNRPYFSVEEMNEALINNWNSVVQHGDTVFCLGDLSLSFKPIEEFSQRLNGQKTLVPGNHDLCHSAHRKSRQKENQEKWKKNYSNLGWFIESEHTQLNLPGVAIVNLCHMPYKGDSTDERYQDFRLRDDGRILLCGHVHEKWKTKRTPLGTLMINVGVDVWGMHPVSIAEIMKLIEAEYQTE